MDTPMLVDKQKFTYISSLRILGVIAERDSRKSILTICFDDEEEDENDIQQF